MDKTKELEKRVEGFMEALFALADDLKKVSGRGPEASLADIKKDVQSAGDSLYISLVALNDGRGPDGKVAEV